MSIVVVGWPIDYPTSCVYDVKVPVEVRQIDQCDMCPEWLWSNRRYGMVNPSVLCPTCTDRRWGNEWRRTAGVNFPV